MLLPCAPKTDKKGNICSVDRPPSSLFCFPFGLSSVWDFVTHSCKWLLLAGLLPSNCSILILKISTSKTWHGFYCVAHKGNKANFRSTCDRQIESIVMIFLTVHLNLQSNIKVFNFFLHHAWIDLLDPEVYLELGSFEIGLISSWNHQCLLFFPFF